LSLEVVELFGLATVEGLPRPGLRRFGVPIGGAFDQESYHLANALLKNPAECPGIELAMASLRLRADRECSVAVVGAEADVWVNGVAVPNQSSLTLAPDDELSIGAPRSGARVFLGLGSDTGGSLITGRRLSRGDRLPAVPKQRSPRLADRPTSVGRGSVRAVPGPQGDLFDLNALVHTPFRVLPSSNRVGVRLEGSHPPHKVELPSEPACPGAIQVTNSGSLIVLGPDGPTIGGYPKAAVVISADLDRVGQLTPGQEVSLELVDHETAIRLRDERHRRIDRLAKEIRLAK